jgi:hypothetical protein
MSNANQGITGAAATGGPGFGPGGFGTDTGTGGGTGLGSTEAGPGLGVGLAETGTGGLAAGGGGGVGGASAALGGTDVADVLGPGGADAGLGVLGSSPAASDPLGPEAGFSDTGNLGGPSLGTDPVNLDEPTNVSTFNPNVPTDISEIGWSDFGKDTGSKSDQSKGDVVSAAPGESGKGAAPAVSAQPGESGKGAAPSAGGPLGSLDITDLESQINQTKDDDPFNPDANQLSGGATKGATGVVTEPGVPSYSPPGAEATPGHPAVEFGQTGNAATYQQGSTAPPANPPSDLAIDLGYFDIGNNTAPTSPVTTTQLESTQPNPSFPVEAYPTNIAIESSNAPPGPSIGGTAAGQQGGMVGGTGAPGSLGIGANLGGPQQGFSGAVVDAQPGASSKGSGEGIAPTGGQTGAVAGSLNPNLADAFSNFGVFGTDLGIIQSNAPPPNSTPNDQTPGGSTTPPGFAVPGVPPGRIDQGFQDFPGEDSQAPDAPNAPTSPPNNNPPVGPPPAGPPPGGGGGGGGGNQSPGAPGPVGPGGGALVAGGGLGGVGDATGGVTPPTAIGGDIIPPGDLQRQGLIASAGPQAITQAIQNSTITGIQSAVANGSLSQAGAQQAMQLQDTLTNQWAQILLNQGGGQIDPRQWAAVQGNIAQQVNQLVAQLGGVLGR